MRKYYLFIVIPLIVLACATPQDDIAATVVPSEIVSATAPAVLIPDQTAAPNLIPKQNDLLFVEFFAVT
jgi:hypothetical protein